MRIRRMKSRFLSGLAASAVMAVAPFSSATAQTAIVPVSTWRSAPCPTCPCPAPIQGAPFSPYTPGVQPTNPAATAPVAPTTPSSPSTPNLTTNPAPNTAAPETTPETSPGQDFGFGGSQGLASGAGTFASPGGYVEDAIPQTMFRLRYDSETGINRFDRASFMFGTWREGSFHPHALVNDNGVRGIFFDRKANGTQIISPEVKDKILSADIEYAFNNRLSAFVDLPYQFVHFGPNIEDGPADQTRAEQRQFPENEVRNAKSDPSGVGDLQAGFKYAVIADENCRYLTFQLRGYGRTGDPGLGLGTGHYSIEPGILAYQRITDRLVAQGEVMDWIPIDAGIGAGSVITFGGGIGYDVIQRCNLRVTPVAEVVGWTVLGGTEAFDGTVPGTLVPAVPTGTPAINVGGVFVPNDHGFREANGDTIVNVKLGVRTYIGQHSDIYAGYGHCVTGSRWYDDIVRVEYRLRF